MNQVVAQQQQSPAKRERIEVIDAVPLLDTSRFEHMQRVATVMARSTLMPESLYMEGKKDNKTSLPYEQILSNCFLVVNQAVRWGLDPFAVAQCVSVVHGKLCYEGKLVAAVLQAKLGMNLHHQITGSGEESRIYLSDRPFSDEATVEGKKGPLSDFLRPGIRAPGFRLFDGSVAEWKTSGTNSPWSPKNFPRMLLYRGTRDWCRIYEPATMLGVYTDDELVDMEESSRFRNARNITPAFDPLSDEPPALQQLASEREHVEPTKTDDEPHDALTGEIIDNTDTGEEDPVPSGQTPDADEGITSLSSAQDGGASPAPSSSSITTADLAWLKTAATMLWAATNIDGDTDSNLDLLNNQRKAVPEYAGASQDVRDKAGSIYRKCKAVVMHEEEPGDVLPIIANYAGCSPADVEGAA